MLLLICNCAQRQHWYFKKELEVIKGKSNLDYIPKEVIEMLSSKELAMAILREDLRGLQDEETEWERGHAGKVILARYLTYNILAQETGTDLQAAIEMLVRLSGYTDNEKVYLVALTCDRVEKLACLELYKLYQQDTSRKHLAVYARDALETAFDI
ncbi:hypothetical protein LCGC14_0143570 [marine sediment metagenome]|uniref:Uncharacterized protein n=1 Tax=marine sediment metagenome TaxID=412755 RepID=A0A0F9Y214_9ZZZZ